MLQCGTPISDFPLIMYIFEFIRIYVCISCTCIYIYTAVYLSLYIYICTYLCIYIYTYIYMYMCEGFTNKILKERSYLLT